MNAPSESDTPRSVRRGGMRTLRLDDEIAEVLSFLDSAQVGKRLGVAPQTVRRWAKTLDGFPQPARREGKASLWRSYEIDRWAHSQKVRSMRIHRSMSAGGYR